jgi:hypothetical protein
VNFVPKPGSTKVLCIGGLELELSEARIGMIDFYARRTSDTLIPLDDILFNK